MEDVKKFNAKIILVPITRAQMYEYVGKTIYRLSGQVRIESISNVIKFTWIDYPDTPVYKDSADGFYIPVAYITNRLYDADERFIPLRISEYPRYERYIAVTTAMEEYKLLPGLVPGKGTVTKILIQHGIGFKQNPFNVNKSDDEELLDFEEHFGI